MINKILNVPNIIKQTSELSPTCSESGITICIADQPSNSEVAAKMRTKTFLTKLDSLEKAVGEKGVRSEESLEQNILDGIDSPMHIEKKRRKVVKCEHGKTRYDCKDCNGSRVCPHGKVKFGCKECGGSSFCEHNRERAKCK